MAERPEIIVRDIDEQADDEAERRPNSAADAKEQLIELVRQYRHLYDPMCKEHHNNVVWRLLISAMVSCTRLGLFRVSTVRSARRQQTSASVVRLPEYGSLFRSKIARKTLTYF